MGSFYSGFGQGKNFLGFCEDGIVYKGSGKKSPIGRYENGNIYNQFKEHVGSYSGGSIYDAFGTHIASYDGGCVYNKYLNVAFGQEQVGSYEGNPAEAAALVLLFLGGNDVNGDNKDKHTPSPSCEGGCLSALFNLVVAIFGAILKLLWPVIKFFTVWFWLPMYVAPTLVGFSAMLFFAISGMETVALGIAFVLIGLEFISIPYWVILFFKKMKMKMLWKETFKYYGKWFIKGPWAYKDIIELKN